MMRHVMRVARWYRKLLTPQSFVAVALVPIVIMIALHYQSAASEQETVEIMGTIAVSLARTIAAGPDPGKSISSIRAEDPVAYVIWQTNGGAVAHSRDVVLPPALAYDDFLSEASGSRRLLHRHTQFGGAQVREFALAFPAGGVSNGILRVGINPQRLHQIQRSTTVQVTTVLITCLILAAVVVNVTLLDQQRRVLQKELEYTLRAVRAAHEEAARNERLVAMGRLAAGIAHEVKNPLNAVSLTLGKLACDCRDILGAPPQAALLSAVQQELRRATDLLDRFLHYARPPELELAATDVNRLCGNVVTIMAAQAERQQVAWDLQLHATRAACIDPEQTQQALLNIVQNALDAMPRGGVIRIETRAVDHLVTIDIRDTGPGIPASERERIFDMYYTTKRKGVGLGLAHVLRTITAQHGHIKVHDHQPCGAGFVVTLPLDDTSPPA